MPDPDGASRAKLDSARQHAREAIERGEQPDAADLSMILNDERLTALRDPSHAAIRYALQRDLLESITPEIWAQAAAGLGDPDCANSNT